MANTLSELFYDSIVYQFKAPQYYPLLQEAGFFLYLEDGTYLVLE